VKRIMTTSWRWQERQESARRNAEREAEQDSQLLCGWELGKRVGGGMVRCALHFPAVVRA
jgi:hypothetical protein